MGLDTSHNCWSGSYGSFMTWRRAVAWTIGIQIDEMVGFGGSISWVGCIDPLKELLRHSDCDGELAVEHLKGIADRLDAITYLLPEQWMQQAAGQFADGCRIAWVRSEPVVFA